MQSNLYVTVDLLAQPSYLRIAPPFSNLLNRYFGSPLSTALEVVSKKDASSIDPRMVFCNLVNCLMWSVYGLAAINDPVVYYPNISGIVLQIINISLLAVYPRTIAKKKMALAGMVNDLEMQ